MQADLKNVDFLCSRWNFNEDSEKSQRNWDCWALLAKPVKPVQCVPQRLAIPVLVTVDIWETNEEHIESLLHCTSGHRHVWFFKARLANSRILDHVRRKSVSPPKQTHRVLRAGREFVRIHRPAVTELETKNYIRSAIGEIQEVFLGHFSYKNETVLYQSGHIAVVRAGQFVLKFMESAGPSWVEAQNFAHHGSQLSRVWNLDARNPKFILPMRSSGSRPLLWRDAMPVNSRFVR